MRILLLSSALLTLLSSCAATSHSVASTPAAQEAAPARLARPGFTKPGWGNYRVPTWEHERAAESEGSERQALPRGIPGWTRR